SQFNSHDLELDPVNNLLSRGQGLELVTESLNPDGELCVGSAFKNFQAIFRSDELFGGGTKRRAVKLWTHELCQLELRGTPLLCQCTEQLFNFAGSLLGFPAIRSCLHLLHNLIDGVP